MLKNNKGFSFVELIIVIAIIVIFMVGGTIGLSYLQNREAIKSAEQIASILREYQALSMTKYETSVVIKRDSSGKIEVVAQTKADKDSSADTKSVIVGDSTVSISYETSAMKKEISGADSLTLIFDRTNGGFETIPGSNDYCEKIYLERGSTTKIIKLGAKTGIISIE